MADLLEAPGLARLDEDAGLRSLSLARLGAVNLPWLGINAVSGALISLVLPLQLEDLLRRSGALPAAVEGAKGTALAWLLGGGALVALVVPILVGAWSDATVHRWGRRRLYILAGTLLALLGLSGLAAPSTLAGVAVAYMVVQAGLNTVTAAAQGYIPDVVPAGQRGVASGGLVGVSLAGQLVGLLIAAAGRTRPTPEALLTVPQQVAVYGALAVCLLIGAAGALGVPEPPRPPAAGSLGTRLRAGWVDLRRVPAFRGGWLTRALVQGGFALGGPLLLYLLQDVHGLPRDQLVPASTLITLGLLGVSLPAAVAAGRVADRVGRRGVVTAAGVGMAAVLGAFVLGGQVALPGPLQPPMLNTLLVLAVLRGLGYGAYQAADWALATDVLPDPARAGSTLGVWHLALAGPQALAGAVGGALLASTAAWGWTPFNRYALLFGLAASLLISGSLLIRRVPGIR